MRERTRFVTSSRSSMEPYTPGAEARTVGRLQERDGPDLRGPQSGNLPKVLPNGYDALGNVIQSGDIIGPASKLSNQRKYMREVIRTIRADNVRATRSVWVRLPRYASGSGALSAGAYPIQLEHLRRDAPRQQQQFIYPAVPPHGALHRHARYTTRSAWTTCPPRSPRARRSFPPRTRTTWVRSSGR